MNEINERISKSIVGSNERISQLSNTFSPKLLVSGKPKESAGGCGVTAVQVRPTNGGTLVNDSFLVNVGEMIGSDF